MRNENILLLKNGLIACGEKRDVRRADVLIKDGAIFQIENNIDNDNYTVIDCTDKIITSGFIDSHVHIESTMVLPKTFGEIVLPYGTTTAICDPHEIVNVSGAKGLDFFLHEASISLVDIYTSVPSSVPATNLDTNGAGYFTAEDMIPYADREDIVGLGEMMDYFAVARGEVSYKKKIELFKNKTIDGHTSGMPNNLIKDYAAAGVQNDHECTDEDSVLERYSCGMNIYIREGSAAHNADVILKCIKKHNLDLSQFSFCTDDSHLSTIKRQGHISNIVRMARNYGFSWGEIACMASYNPSRYYRLGKRGDITVGNIADIVVVDKDSVSVEYVIKNGKLVAKENRLITSSGLIDDSLQNEYENTVHFDNLCKEDFILSDNLKRVAIELVDKQLLTRKISVNPDEIEGLSTLLVVERHGKNNNRAACLLKGYNIKGGAVATSVSHDSHNIICAGDNIDDMILACERLKLIGGGYVIASNNEIAAELALPIFGLITPINADLLSEKMDKLHDVAHSLSINQNIDPFTTLSFAALPVIPSIRLLDTGLYDVENGTFIR